MGPDDLRRAGEAAIDAADWATARSCLEQALDQDPDDADALTALSKVAMIERRYEDAIDLKERAFDLHRRAGRAARASDNAAWLAFMHVTYHGNLSAGLGWKARATSVLEGVTECAAHGWLALLNAPFADSPAEREALASQALAIARRFGDDDLEVEALALRGEALVCGGRVADGMELLDEAMAAVTAGRVRDHFALGEIFCRLLSACEAALDVRRATDWLAMAERHVAWTDFVRPTCRAHYGGLLVAHGRWADAETELRTSIEGFERGYRGDRIVAVLRLADLRVRQGRVAEAEQLIAGYEWHPAARRLAAAIALVRGEAELAAELAALCTEGASPDDPACAPALELLVAARVAAGDVAAARDAAGALGAIAESCGLDRVGAAAALARGRVRATEGDANAAGELQRAVELFAALELPLDAARAQLELARALASPAPAAAMREAKLAGAAFDRLGATPDADVTAQLLRSLGAEGGRSWPRGTGGLTRREREVLALLAEGCTNAQIAKRLVISPRTAEHHVASILSKLDLHGRAEAAAYALRHPG